MTINIGGYSFNGPYSSPEELTNQGGIYVILCHKGNDYYPIDVGESGEIKDRVKDHNRKECWEEKGNSSLNYFELLTPGKRKEERAAIEKEIRDVYDFPCGSK